MKFADSRRHSRKKEHLLFSTSQETSQCMLHGSEIWFVIFFSPIEFMIIEMG